MNGDDRDRDIIAHIIRYCDDIIDTQSYFGNSFDVFKGNAIYRNATAMCVLQIGELSGYLSDSFKEVHKGIPWRNIKGMRNIMAHKYGDINASILWETISADVPLLKKYCLGVF